MKKLTRVAAAVGCIGAVAIAAIVASGMIGGTARSNAATGQSEGGSSPTGATIEPAAVEGVPASLPSEGVDINEQVVLRQLATSASDASSYLTEGEAAAVAKHEASSPALSEGKPLLASVTLPASIPPPGSTTPYKTIENVPAWVVTFTAPEPSNVSLGPPGSPPVMMQHYSVAINASTGEFILGFYTR